MILKIQKSSTYRTSGHDALAKFIVVSYRRPTNKKEAGISNTRFESLLSMLGILWNKFV